MLTEASRREAFRRLAVPVMAWAGIAALVSCGSAPTVRSAGGTLSIDVPGAGWSPGAPAEEVVRREGTMEAGERLEIRLGAASGTGYAWTLAGPIPAIFQMRSSDPAGAPVPVEGEAARPGGPAWSLFGMDAVSQGEADLRFVLVRPWESGKPPARQVDLHVVVRPAAQRR